ncbi:hypothetical protein AB8O64_36090 (plasmid) [Streptomyces sp. QH1-20]|uniref:hypothetical protein n=1 Tax=Streptomyces sp. QH1-20 TaxID=3240934 RepID=UPI003513A1D3
MSACIRRLGLAATAFSLALLIAPLVPGEASAADPMVGKLCMYTRRSAPNDLDKTLRDLLLSKPLSVPQTIVDTNDFEQVMAYLIGKYGDQKTATEALLNAAATAFGTGSFGHSWLACFPDTGQKATTYGYHANGPGKPAFQVDYLASDSPSRDHEARICRSIDQAQHSELDAIVAKEQKDKTEYAWNQNCTDFSGRTWNLVMAKGSGPQLEYQQKPQGKGLAAQLLAALGTDKLATPGQLGYVIGAANGSEQNRVFKIPTEITATAPLPGSDNAYGVFTKERFAAIRLKDTSDTAVAGSRPESQLTSGTAFPSFDTVATFTCNPLPGRNSYRYYVFSGSRYATVDAHMSGDDIVIDGKGSPQNLATVPALAGFDHVDAVMNVTSRTDQCSTDGRTLPADFAVFSGNKYRQITVDSSGNLIASSPQGADKTLKIDKVNAALDVESSSKRSSHLVSLR